LAAIAFLSVTAAGSARAASSLESATVQATPTFETAGIRVMTTGDDNADAAGTVQYRVAGQSEWLPAHPLIRIAPNRLASLLFNLKEGTDYDVAVTLTDPDGGGTATKTAFSTRTTPRSSSVGRKIYVTPSDSIAVALRDAKPGDTIFLRPGTYSERVIHTTTSGTPDAPITIRPTGPGVRIMGNIAALEDPHTTPLWKRESDGLYSTSVPGVTNYVATDGVRLYNYTSREALVSGPRPGWWQDGSFTIFAKLAGDASPDSVPVQVTQVQEPFLFEGVHDIILDGLDIGYFGAAFGHGVYIRNSSNITVRNCRIHHIPLPVLIKGNSNNNLIENNHIYDTGLDDWPWTEVKSTSMDNSGVVVVDGGSANVVRGNNVHGMFNGVVTFSGTGDNVGDSDVYYNWIHNIGDDGLEPEPGNVNFRAWCNTVYTAQNTVSLAPIQSGPVWLLYNVLGDFKEAGLKVSNDSAGVVRAYHNTIVTTRPGTNGMSPWTPYANIVLRNNILMSTLNVIEDYYADAARGVSFDGDLLYTTAPGRFLKWKNVRYPDIAALSAATGQETHGISANPEFVSAKDGDFRISPASPARHKAIVIPGINDFLGFAPDIGAYQMGR
jgi:hypothetical protein